MNNQNIKTALLAAAAALAGSSLTLIVLGAAALVPMAATVIIVGAALTAIFSGGLMLLVITAGSVTPASHAPAESMKPRSDFSVIDPLTRTMNRRGITIGIMDAMALGERYGNPLSVARLDLDGLAAINDKYGKEAGDRILAGAAAVLADALRMPDKIGRFGDDEFVLVMPQTRIDDAFMIADRLRKLVERQRFDVDGTTAIITISVGVTEYTDGDDLESLMSRIQKGVDKSREAGRNTVTRV